ncbi:MAG TPA: hypothetical protein VFX11_00750 [Candidatus Kapabacteria bacterium]|nr:hypothetical protein [Candidatus Kapabacteria bacterium]
MPAPDKLPVVPLVPAPWQLKGQGYILAIRLPDAFLDHQSFIADSQRHTRRGRVAYVMFVDYRESDVGPYHELLYIPGTLAFGRRRHLSISKIYVSTRDSVVNGHANWGIPKERCDFQVRYGVEGVDEVRLLRDGQVIAELDLRPRLFRVPFDGRLVPARFRTLAQHFEGREFTYIPVAKGHVRPASLVRSRFDSRHFPDISQGKVVACVKVTDFDMTFPVATVRMLD